MNVIFRRLASGLERCNRFIPSQSELSVVTSYRGISDCHSNKMVITKGAMKEMYGDMNFDQLRFHCQQTTGAHVPRGHGR